MTKAIVFDMDGVLFDTENLVKRCWQQVADRENIEGIEEVLFKCIGTNRTATRRIFLDTYGENFDYEGFREQADVLFHTEIEENGMPVKEGAYELLEFLASEDYIVGLASSTRIVHVKSELERARIEHYFKVIVGGDMVEHSKPHPQIYQEACKRLGIEPNEAYCVEDSFNGIRAGHAAGLKVIMVPDLIKPTDEILKLVYKKFDSLLEVKDYLLEVK